MTTPRRGVKRSYFLRARRARSRRRVEPEGSRYEIYVDPAEQAFSVGIEAADRCAYGSPFPAHFTNARTVWASFAVSLSPVLSATRRATLASNRSPGSWSRRARARSG
jgi:hypothetical protein